MLFVPAGRCSRVIQVLHQRERDETATCWRRLYCLKSQWPVIAALKSQNWLNTGTCKTAEHAVL